MHIKLILILFTALFMHSNVFAEVQINGFASVVTGIDFEDDEVDDDDYGSRTTDNLQESKVALQWSADLGEGIRFVGQTMAKGSSSEGFKLTYEWAYFDFNVGDSGKFKFGRLRIPFYKYSDYLDVGYAYHWITPPKSMYSIDYSNVDGIGYQQNFTSLGLDHTLNLTLGALQQSVDFDGEDVQAQFENFIAINWSATLGNHEFNAAYSQSDGYIPASDLVGLETIAQLGGDSGVTYNGDRGYFIGIGYKGTFGPLSIFTEYSTVGIENAIFADFSGGYLGASYSINEYTYHITYGMRENEEKEFTGTTANTDLGAFVPPPDGPITTGITLNSTARSFGNGDSTTITIGARKEVGATTAVKIDLDLYTEDKVQDAFAASVSEERKATVLKFAVETMF